MPPNRKITRNDIVDVSLEILKEEDLDALNARKIASKLHCSVQPIFYNFTSMDELKGLVFDEVYHIYQEYMIKGSKEQNSYKGMGLSYIKFARDYPNYFKLIFMSKTNLSPEKFLLNDDMGNHVIEAGMKLTSFDYEMQKKFHLKVWVFTHGLACLVATKTVNISLDEISVLLEETVRSMIIGVKKENT